MFSILFAIILSPIAIVAGAFSNLFVWFSIKSIFTTKKPKYKVVNGTKQKVR